MRMAIVADDLTGAADAAVTFADCGIETKVCITLPKEFSDETCYSVDADARWRDKESTAETIHKCACALKDADWLMLKIDSTLRGFVGAMVKATWQASERQWILLAPAVPKQGRIVRDGQLFVHSKTLTETDLANEQPAPIATSIVIERLRDTGLDNFPLRLLLLEEIRRQRSLTKVMGQVAMSKLGLVCDAETNGDLKRLINAAVNLPLQPLLVGASGLAKALAETLSGKFNRKRKALPPIEPGRILIVAGSQQSLAQIQLEFLAARGVPVKEASFAELPTFPNAPVVAVKLKGNKELMAKGIGQMRKFVSKNLQEWLKPEVFDALVIVGGLTARLVFEALGVKSWDLFGSLVSGVPFGLVHTREHLLLVATKAGGFGTEKTLWQIVKKLRGARLMRRQCRNG